MNIQLKDHTAGPVYMQIREQIEAQIRNKQVRAGEALPSPALLAQKLSVDKGEVQRAYHELERSGLVKRATSKNFLGEEKVSYLIEGAAP